MIAYKDISGIRIAYWRNSEDFQVGRKNIVFVHGSAGNHTNWQAQYNVLENKYNIVAVDLPGHGQSEGKGEQEVDHYVEWIDKLVDALHLDKPVIIGHSLGAAIALSFAIQQSQKLSGIVPIGGGVTMPVNALILDGMLTDPAATTTLLAKFSITKGNRETLMDFLALDFAKAAPEITYGDYLSCNRLDLRAKIGNIGVPTLLVCGQDDKMTPPEYSKFLRDQIPGARLELITAAGHFVMLENPAALNKVLQTFVDSL